MSLRLHVREEVILDPNTDDFCWMKTRVGMGNLCCCTPCANVMEDHYDMKQIREIRVGRTVRVRVCFDCLSWTWKTMELAFRNGTTKEVKMKFSLDNIQAIGSFFQSYYGPRQANPIIIVICPDQ